MATIETMTPSVVGTPKLVVDAQQPINIQPAGYSIESVPVAGSVSIGSGPTTGQISPRP